MMWLTYFYHGCRLLEDNEISALPDGIFQDLPRLRELNLENNQIAAIPDGIFYIPTLKMLNLEHNRLANIPFGTFAQITQPDTFVRVSTGNSLSCFPPSPTSITLSQLDAYLPACECPAGTYLESLNATNCTECTALCDQGEELCPAGSTSNGICRMCPAGTFGILYATCTPCPEGTYQHSLGSSSCLSCPEGQTTMKEGSTTIAQCLCSEGSSNAHGGTFALPGGQINGIGGATDSISKLSFPMSIAVYSSGEFAVIADTKSHSIKRVSVRNGSTQLLAGSGSAGYVEGYGSVAAFWEPSGVALSEDELFVYVSDTNNHRVRMIELQTGRTGLLAGSEDPDCPGTNKNLLDQECYGTESASPARPKMLFRPVGIAVQPHKGHVWVTEPDSDVTQLGCDGCPGRIRKISFPHVFGQIGNVSTVLIASSRSIAMSFDGTFALFTDNNIIKRLIISDNGQTSVLQEAHNISILAGNSHGYGEGAGTTASFALPSGLVVDPSGQWALIADTQNNRIRRLDLASSQTISIAGPGRLEDGLNTDGVGTMAKLNQPGGIALLPGAKIAVFADTGADSVRFLSVDSDLDYSVDMGWFSSCPPCLASTHSKVPGSDSCDVCELNTYSPAGASECTPCPRSVL
mmetsp:Transcript_23217/g.58160  ORF Transcript_23217/g.58160 Transcript_23217/m.58160 type:complete len:634 (-) Transcript_23217:888-2789(-)